MSDDTSNVVAFTGQTTVDEPPEQALEKAKSWGLTRVVIVGEDEDGNLKWGMSFGDAATINWLLDLAKYDLIHRHPAG